MSLTALCEDISVATRQPPLSHPAMAKVDLDLVKHILTRNELDVRQVNSIIEDLQQELKIQQEENPPAPRVKKQFIILVSDPDNRMPQLDLTGWVLQIPEDDSPMAVEEQVHKAAYEFNQTPKGRRLPVKTVGEACEAVPARIFKEHQVWVKTKEPVLIQTTPNAIPMDTSSLDDGL